MKTRKLCHVSETTRSLRTFSLIKAGFKTRRDLSVSLLGLVRGRKAGPSGHQVCLPVHPREGVLGHDQGNRVLLDLIGRHRFGLQGHI